MKVKFITLGCKVNQYESEAMLEAFLAAGHTQAGENEPADVVVLNSCTVTATGDQKARQYLRRAKRDNPNAVIVLTGCMPQAFPQEAAALTEADIVTGTKNRGQLLSKIETFVKNRERIVDIPPHENGDKFEKLPITLFHGRTRAFLKIQDGCNRFCSYCIIPYARGRVRSKPLEDVKKEACQLAANGYTEIVLTGINLPAYGQDMGMHLCDAVDAVCEVQGIRRVRLGSLEPERLTPDVIARLKAQEKLCPQFHLSLQSGCDETLKRMNRHYTNHEYRKITADLRAAFPNCAVTTDVMVGFSGETEEEFESSLAFVKEISFAKVHVFAYSRRPGTKAYNAPDQVTNKVKEERSRVMSAAAKETQKAFFESQLGRTEDVLFEQPAGENIFEGYTKNYTPVRVFSEKPISGMILPVRITSAEDEFCRGELD